MPLIQIELSEEILKKIDRLIRNRSGQVLTPDQTALVRKEWAERTIELFVNKIEEKREG